MSEKPAAALRRLIYISSAAPGMKESEVEKILASSRANNAANGLTGMLLFHDGCFFQVLEGEEESVARTFAVISRDTRHGGLIVMESKPVADRGFPQWSMGFLGAHALHPAQRQWLIDLSDRVASENPTPLSELAGINVHIDAFLSSFREFA